MNTSTSRKAPATKAKLSVATERSTLSFLEVQILTNFHNMSELGKTVYFHAIKGDAEKNGYRQAAPVLRLVQGGAA